MYKINDTVMYGVDGICNISDISTRDFNGKKIEYYILKPIYNNKATIFVPIKNKELTDKMHRILSSDEIYALVQAIPEESETWIENESIRKEKFKEILSKGNRAEIMLMIKMIYEHEKELKQAGKKLHMIDDKFFKEAEKLLYDEFAHVLGINREQVVEFIIEQISAAKKQKEN